MKLASGILAFMLLALSSTDALTADDLVKAVIGKENELVRSFPGALNHDLPKDGGYALIKFLVKPSDAKDFIEAIRKAKKGAENSEGYIAYDLVKTLDDNLTFFNWHAWESREELYAFFKSDSVKELIEFVKKDDIVAIISNAKPVV